MKHLYRVVRCPKGTAPGYLPWHHLWLAFGLTALGLPPPAPAVRDPWEERAWAPREDGLDPTDDGGRMLAALERSGGHFSTAPSGSGPGSSPGTPGPIPDGGGAGFGP